MIVDHSDLTSILCLRQTSLELRAHAQAILLDDKTALLAFYVARHDKLWQHLADWGAVVGGFAALSFLLRDPLLLNTTLEIYVSPLNSDHLEQVLQEDFDLALAQTGTQHWRLNRYATCRQISHTTSFICPNGRYIDVHTAATSSSLDPIASSVITAFSNWVSPHAFACAYPALTLRRRALRSLPSSASPELPGVYSHLIGHGFSIEQDAASWSDWSALVQDVPPPGSRPCLRQAFLCLTQARYFGDAGSLLNVFEPKEYGLRRLRSEHLPPFGISVVWRMLGPPCDGPCSFKDPLLPGDIITLPSVLIPPTTWFRLTYVGPDVVSPI
ncbi:hypothetical protein TRAPUB_4911 [Trametes pubescens]|uniref:Uncharacterized protein n=1 Tax=Trametes pubescens TaxID=154538 RepID=A0A1M2V9Q8_TRAPU|nr:hypothetical protein TRAPUB_4911 [Trametes pubescens]